MAKAPQIGAVKTRLCPPLAPAQAADLARAFLIDTWSVVSRLAGLAPILACSGDPTLLPAELATAERWPQRSGDLGARIEGVLERGLCRSRGVVIIGSDAPGLPAALIGRAARLLGQSDCVLGPTLDGGYYLIAARRSEAGLLANLPWSSARTLRATYRRLRRRGYSVSLLPTWFDVDTVGDLELLHRCLRVGLISAPATAALLARWDGRWRQEGRGSTPGAVR